MARCVLLEMFVNSCSVTSVSIVKTAARQKAGVFLNLQIVGLKMKTKFFVGGSIQPTFISVFFYFFSFLLSLSSSSSPACLFPIIALYNAFSPC